MSKAYKHECDTDVQHELDGIAEREAHEEKRCGGYPGPCMLCRHEWANAHQVGKCKPGCPFCEREAAKRSTNFVFERIFKGN
jgi:hypothetical protein